MPRPFHLAVPVDDLDAARGFYGAVMGCPEGRSSAEWIDYDFFGHQLVVHKLADAGMADGGTDAGMADGGQRRGHNPVDGHDVPVPHFGVVLTPAQFETLAARIADAGVGFVIPPTLRFAGKPGEQRTMFLYDPAGNALEFKAFADDARLFAVD